MPKVVVLTCETAGGVETEVAGVFETREAAFDRANYLLNYNFPRHVFDLAEFDTTAPTEPTWRGSIKWDRSDRNAPRIVRSE